MYSITKFHGKNMYLLSAFSVTLYTAKRTQLLAHMWYCSAAVFVTQTSNICAACTVHNLMWSAHYVADVLMLEIWATNTYTAVSHEHIYVTCMSAIGC